MRSSKHVHFIVVTFLAMASLNAQAQCVAPPAGMVGWWPGDGDPRDLAGMHSGTLQGGPTFGGGIVGTAFVLDGIDDAVEIANEMAFDLERTDAFTIEAWVQLLDKPPGGGPDARNHFILAKQASASPFRGFGLAVATNISLGLGGPGGRLDLRLCFEDASACNRVHGSTDVLDGAFHHVAATYDGTGTSGMHLYVDGALESISVHSTDLGPGTILSDVPLTIGSREPGGVSIPARGTIDEVAIYRRVLSAAEIQAIFAAGSAGKCKPAPLCLPVSGSLLSLWPGEGDASDIVGVSPGTLLDGATFATGIAGQAFSLDGEGDAVEISNEASFDFEQTDAFTIEAWVRLPDHSNGYIVAKLTDSFPFRGFGLAALQNDNLALPGLGGRLQHSLCHSLGLTCNRVYGHTNVLDDVFHHVAATYDGTGIGGMRLYVDGEPEVLTIQSDGLDGFTILNDVPLRIGSRDEGGVALTGLIDEVAIHDRALSASEVQAIFFAGAEGRCNGAPAGRVPGGPLTPGPLVRVDHGVGGMIELDWSDSCNPEDADYSVYEGAIDSFFSHTPQLCSTGGQTSAIVLPRLPSVYYLIVPHGSLEGSYGVDSDLIERPPGAPACLTQAIAACP